MQYLYWYDSGGSNYSDSLGLGYDVCAITFLPHSVYNNTNARAQYDDGSCLAAFNSDCVDALRQQSQDIAFQLVGNPSPLPDSNLTATSLPEVCDKLAQAMSPALPQSCKPFMNETRYDVAGQALTTNYESSGLFFGAAVDPCMISTANRSFSFVNGYDTSENSTLSHVQYDRVLRVVLPTLTVFMPVANARRDVSMDYVTSVLRCLRPTHFNEGSRIPPRAPQPKALSSSSKKLSGGAIAGIAVGSVAGVGLFAAALSWWWLRKRKAKKQHSVVEPAASHVVSYPNDKPEVLPYVDASSPIVEMGEENALQEMDSQDPHQPELPDAANKERVELVGSLPCRQDGSKRATKGLIDDY